MKLRKSLTLIMVIILLTFPIIGCHNAAEPEVKASPARIACIEMMQKVPVYYEDFEFWDVRTLREDPDLVELYQIWYERKVEFLEQNYGMQSTGINYLAQGEGMLDIINADYDIGTLRDKVSLDFYRDAGYEDMDVWKSEPSHDPQSPTGGWVLAEGLLVKGANNSNVDDYLRVATGEELSMYDSNAAELLERLPEGDMTRISRSPYPEGLVVSGMSVKKEGKNILRWANVYKFESVEAAGSPEADEYFQRIKEDFTKSVMVNLFGGAYR